MGQDGQERLLQSIALKRLGSPEDIAHAVLFLRIRLCRLDLRPGDQRGRRQVSDVEAHLAANFDAYVDELKAFCAIPSVSTDPAFARSVRRAAAFVADRLRGPGFEAVEIVETGGNPAVVGEMVSRSRRADHPRLRPLRRAAARSAREMDDAAVRADSCETIASMRAASPTTRDRC